VISDTSAPPCALPDGSADSFDPDLRTFGVDRDDPDPHVVTGVDPVHAQASESPTPGTIRRLPDPTTAGGARLDPQRVA